MKTETELEIERATYELWIKNILHKFFASEKPSKEEAEKYMFAGIPDDEPGESTDPEISSEPVIAVADDPRTIVSGSGDATL